MESLVIMSAPSVVGSREWGVKLLERIVAERPGITWGELASAARVAQVQDFGLGGPGGLDGWFTNTLKAVGAAADPFTGGLTSKTLIAARDVGESVFSKTAIKDSLKQAGQTVAGDALDRFLNALPFGIGDDFRTGYVVNRYWVIAGIAVVFLFFFLRKK